MVEQLPLNGRLIQTIVYLIREIGITTVVILVFLGMFTGYINSPMTETKALLESHDSAAKSVRKTQSDLLEELVKAQRATCVISAKTESDKRLCLQ